MLTDILLSKCTLFIRCELGHSQLNFGLRFFFLSFSCCCSSIGLIAIADGSMESKEGEIFSLVCCFTVILICCCIEMSEIVFNFIFVCTFISPFACISTFLLFSPVKLFARTFSSRSCIRNLSVIVLFLIILRYS